MLTLDDLEGGLEARVDLPGVFDLGVDLLADLLCNGGAIDLGGRHVGRGAGKVSLGGSMRGSKRTPP